MRLIFLYTVCDLAYVRGFPALQHLIWIGRINDDNNDRVTLRHSVSDPCDHVGMMFDSFYEIRRWMLVIFVFNFNCTSLLWTNRCPIQYLLLDYTLAVLLKQD